MSTRSQLRQEFVAKRRTLDAAVQYQAAMQLTQHVTQNPIFQQSKNIAFYIAVNGEIDPLAILELAQQQQKNCYLPVLDAKEPHLHFVAYKPGDVLVPNRFKILEPARDPAKIIPAEKLDLVLVPLVAVDNQGNRIGSGAGYYDRTFAFLKQQPRPTKPYLLGLAYQWQKVESLAAETWDVPLDAIATEVGANNFSPTKVKE